MSKGDWREGLTDEEIHRFVFFSNGAPMRIEANVSHIKTSINLTEESVHAVAESLLRQAQLYDSEAMSCLYIQVFVIDKFFTVTLKFHKLVRDLATNQVGLASTFMSNGVGGHGRNTDSILESVDEYVYQFLTPFLFINKNILLEDRNKKNV